MKVHPANLNDPLVKKGIKHIKTSVFVSERRKEKLRTEYTSIWQVENKENCSFFLFLRKKEDPHTWDHLIQITLWRIHVFRKLVKDQSPISLYVWPTPWKKVFPSSTTVLLPDHINSGSCTTYKKEKEICIWRTQEYPKVLIHELLHAFHVNQVTPIEANTEYLAILLNAKLELMERKLPSSMLPCLLEDEKLFGLHQAQQLQGYDTKKTNAHQYLSERNRYLWQVSKKKWEQKIKNLSVPYLKGIVPEGSARFSIADLLLATRQRPRIKFSPTFPEFY